ncbi:uncharacterized protein LOC134177568 [Corticium candelabrum]|uniref:uncharacterized protein LOC134177568 n=1 Tax=Corticium candelabrum TaxID=121492 RepID=UPI002E26846D|nr:uncharacterized protein LOC134177568 [Corticium candelabrum]
MVLCIVVGCSNRSGRDKDVSFYRIPVIRTTRSEREFQLSKAQREGFLAAVSRQDLTNIKLENERICSRHFVTGNPADLFDDTNPDGLPSQLLVTLTIIGSFKESQKTKSVERYQRRLARQEKTSDQMPCRVNLEPEIYDEEENEQADDFPTDHIDGLRKELAVAYSTISSLKHTIQRLSPSQKIQCSRQLMGSFSITLVSQISKVLKAVFDYVTPQDMRTKLSRFQEFMVVLIKLRLNLSNEDLCYRFDVCRSTISRILSRWLTILDAELQPLILWPDRDILRKTMPKCFLSSFGEKWELLSTVLKCLLKGLQIFYLEHGCVHMYFWVVISLAG